MGLQFFMGVLASLFAAFIAWICKQLIDKFECRSGLSGKWEVEIYDGEGNVAKRDMMILKHNKRTGEIKGEEKREFPYEQKHRKWKLNGRFSKNVILATAFAKEDINSHASGCFKLIDDGFFSGYYLKYNDKESKIEMVKINIKKCENRL